MTTATSNACERSPHIAIIGGGLGGLSAAIRLRAAGYAVTLYEKNTTLGGRANVISDHGFRFDTGPSLLNYPWVFEELFTAAGRRMADYVELLPVDPSIRFYWPDGEHLQLTSNFPRLVTEFDRVEPGAGTAFWFFFADAAFKYDVALGKLATRNADSLLDWVRDVSLRELLSTAVWRNLDRELKRFFPGPRIRAALGAYGMYLGGSPHELPGLFSILPYGELAYGLWLPRGGIYGLVEGMERLARELGVAIRLACPVRRIVQRAEGVAGIELSDGTVQTHPVVVSNVDVPTTHSQLLEGRIKPPRRLRMTPAVLTFYWGIRGKLPSTGHHTIFLPDDARTCFKELITIGRIPRELPFYISVPSETDPALAPAGHSAVFVLVPLPTLSKLAEHGTNDAGADLTGWCRQRVLQRMAQHGIALDPADIVYEQVLDPAQWGERFGLHDGSAFGAAHTLMQMGPFRYPNSERATRGLYYVGASTVPGTGMPMVTLGGRMVAERILADYPA